MPMNKAINEALRLYGLALLKYEQFQITQISAEVTPQEQELIPLAGSVPYRIAGSIA